MTAKFYTVQSVCRLFSNNLYQLVGVVKDFPATVSKMLRWYPENVFFLGPVNAQQSVTKVSRLVPLTTRHLQDTFLALVDWVGRSLAHQPHVKPLDRSKFPSAEITRACQSPPHLLRNFLIYNLTQSSPRFSGNMDVMQKWTDSRY